MVYGKILFNNIKQYTPKWFATIPYSQTVKPTFTRQPQVVSHLNANQNVKRMWRIFGSTIQRNSWAWQILIFFITFSSFHLIYEPFLFVYRENNKNRTYQAAMKKQKEHKKKQRQALEAEHAAKSEE